MTRPNIVDLFCGAGGFSLGAHESGFRTAVAIDIDTTLTSSFCDNFAGAPLMRSDISRVTGSEIRKEAGLDRGQVAGVVGGPPCQGFSLIGKRRTSDPRNALVAQFFRIVYELKPKFFIMENVPGILVGAAKHTLDCGLSLVEDYQIVGPLVADAWDYGAATQRERVVIIGYDKNEMGPLSEQDIQAAKAAYRPTVADAIADLPEPNKCNWSRYRRPKHQASQYAKQARSQPSEGLGADLYKERLARGLVSGVLPTAHTNEVALRFRNVKPGSREQISRCPRLAWDKPCPTLRAGTGPERGSYQSIRPIHPESDRVITVREAARLQGFPDWFKFHETKWHSFRMIGNSVSPAISSNLLAVIASALS